MLINTSGVKDIREPSAHIPVVTGEKVAMLPPTGEKHQKQ